MNKIYFDTNNIKQLVKYFYRSSLLVFFMAYISFTSNSVSAVEPLVVLTTFSEEPMKTLFEEFQQLNPEVPIQVVYRRTGPALRWVKQSSIHPVDMIISSSPTFFRNLDNAGLIVVPSEHYPPPTWLETHDLTKSNKTIVLGYSGITIMYNKRYLEKNHLPIPLTWKDLTDPQFESHIMMSTPNNSGTTHMMVEGILQQKGWDKGWAILRELGGNLASVSARSFGVSESISRGLVGAGVVIDSYAINAKEKFTFTDYNYLPNTVILPTYMFITSRGRNNATVEKLIHYFLSIKGQNLISSNIVAKHSLNDASLAQRSERSINPEILFNRAEIIKKLFDQVITYQLPKLQLAWKLIHEAEKLTNISSNEQMLIAQARQLASRIPITEAESISDELQDQFSTLYSNHKYTSDIDLVLYQWRKKSESDLEQAIALISTLLSKNI